MSLVAKFGSFQMPAASSDQIPVSTPGMIPQVVLFLWNGRDSAVDDSGEESLRSGFGWAARTAQFVYVQRVVAYTSLHGAEGGETDSYASALGCIATITPSTDDPGAVEGAAEVDGLGNGEEFTLFPGNQFDAALRVHYLAIGGGNDPQLDGDSDITDLAVGTFEITATGDVDVTDVGFQPDLLMVLSWGSGTEEAVVAGARFVLGIAAGVGLDQFFCYARSADTALDITDASHFQESGGVITAGADDHNPTATLVAMLPDGFRLNVEVAPASPTKHYYLAIKGGRYKTKELYTSDVDTAAVALTDVGFPPIAGLFVSASPDFSSNDLSLSIGAAAGNPIEQGAVLAQDKTGEATSAAFTALDYANVYINADDLLPPTIEGKMAVVSFDGDGASLIQTDGDPEPMRVMCLLIGEELASPLISTYGFLYVGAPVIYVHSVGQEETAFLDQPYAQDFETVNLAVMRNVGGVMTKVSILSVPSQSDGSGPPYWVPQAGQSTSPPIMSSSE